MKRYLYIAHFRAYDRPAIHYWHIEQPVNLGIIENWILSICNTAQVTLIFEIDLDSPRRFEQKFIYKNNELHHTEHFGKGISHPDKPKTQKP